MTPFDQGRAPTGDETKIIEAAAEHWRKVAYDAPIQSIARLEDAAKQLVTLIGSLQGVYFAVFAFSNLKERLSGPLLLPYLAPIVLWLISLYYATRVFIPQPRRADVNDLLSPGAWLELREAYFGTRDDKLRSLRRAHRWLLASFVVVTLLLAALAFLPSAAPTPTQIIILTPTPRP